jgi:hypothetical protein
LLLRISTVREALAKFKIKTVEVANLKTSKGGQKEHSQREGHDGRASRVKTFQRLAMLKTTPLDCEKKQSMSEEARPVAAGERTVKSGG